MEIFGDPQVTQGVYVESMWSLCGVYVNTFHRHLAKRSCTEISHRDVSYSDVAQRPHLQTSSKVSDYLRVLLESRGLGIVAFSHQRR